MMAKNAKNSEDNKKIVGPVNASNVVNNSSSLASQMHSPQKMYPMPAMQNYAQNPQNAEVKPIDFNQIKTKLEDVKKTIVKKYGFTMAIVMLPQLAYPLFEEDE